MCMHICARLGWDFGDKSFSKFSHANEATSTKINAVKRTRNRDII